MKFTFFVVFLVVILTRASADQQEEEVEKARKHCDVSRNVDSTKIIDRLKAGNATDQDELELGKHSLCINVRLGLQKPNGDYETDNLRKKLEERGRYNRTKIEDLIAKCGTRPANSTAEQAARRLPFCFYENRN